MFSFFTPAWQTIRKGENVITSAAGILAAPQVKVGVMLSAPENNGELVVNCETKAIPSTGEATVVLCEDTKHKHHMNSTRLFF